VKRKKIVSGREGGCQEIRSRPIEKEKRIRKVGRIKIADRQENEKRNFI